MRTPRLMSHPHEQRADKNGSESECNLSLTSSIQETLHRARGEEKHSSTSELRDSDAVTSRAVRDERRKELDKIEGIPAYPNTAEFAGWKREVRYAVAAASVEPERALRHLLEAEKWEGDATAVPKKREFATLDVKFGKALRAILRGDVRREVANLEE